MQQSNRVQCDASHLKLSSMHHITSRCTAEHHTASHQSHHFTLCHTALHHTCKKGFSENGRESCAQFLLSVILKGTKKHNLNNYARISLPGVRSPGDSAALLSPKGFGLGVMGRVAPSREDRKGVGDTESVMQCGVCGGRGEKGNEV